MVKEFECLGPAGSLRCPGMSQPGVIVPIRIAVSPHFTPDHRTVTPDPITDPGATEPGVKTTHDLDAFTETEPMTPPTRAQQIPRIG